MGVQCSLRSIFRMLDLVAKGIASNKEEVFKDFDHTDCDIFGGDVSAGTMLDPTIWGLVILLLNLWCSNPCKLCWKYIVRAHTAYKINSLKMFLSELYESETNRYIIFKVLLCIKIFFLFLLALSQSRHSVSFSFRTVCWEKWTGFWPFPVPVIVFVPGEPLAILIF